MLTIITSYNFLTVKKKDVNYSYGYAIAVLVYTATRVDYQAAVDNL